MKDTTTKSRLYRSNESKLLIIRDIFQYQGGMNAKLTNGSASLNLNEMERSNRHLKPNTAPTIQKSKKVSFH